MRILLVILFNSFFITAQNTPDFISVDGGEFIMGKGIHNGESDSKPLHKVIVKNFSISITEITVAQYKTYSKATKTSMPKAPSWGWKSNNPIVSISWFDAKNYCKWLSKKINKKITLPTEAQWEFAARGGLKSKDCMFAGGNNANDVAWFQRNSKNKVHKVASKTPNELGLYDMSGNVLEWCLDTYEADFYKKNKPVNLHKGNRKVLRGGSYKYNKIEARVNNRYFGYANTGKPTRGFRVVINQ